MNDTIFIINAQEDTPMVKMEVKDNCNYITIEGISMPENGLDFFNPLNEKLKSFFESNLPCELELNIVYMNSIFNKQILKIIVTLYDKMQPFKLIWKYSSSDELMRIKGDEIKSVFPEMDVLFVEF